MGDDASTLSGGSSRLISFVAAPLPLDTLGSSRHQLAPLIFLAAEPPSLNGDLDHPTVAVSERLDHLFVLADQHAPTAARATEALLKQAAAEWGYKIDGSKLPRPFRLWYKETGGGLQPCVATDPDAASHWWVFPDIPPGVIDAAGPP